MAVHCRPTMSIVILIASVTLCRTELAYILYSFVRYLKFYTIPGKRAEYCDKRVCMSYHSTQCVFPSISQEPHRRISPTLLFMLPMVLARSCTGGIASCHVLLVLWIVDDVIFSHNGQKQATREGVGLYFVIHQEATPEYVVNDCFLISKNNHIIINLYSFKCYYYIEDIHQQYLKPLKQLQVGLVKYYNLICKPK